MVHTMIDTYTWKDTYRQGKSPLQCVNGISPEPQVTLILCPEAEPRDRPCPYLEAKIQEYWVASTTSSELVSPHGGPRQALCRKILRKKSRSSPPWRWAWKRMSRGWYCYLLPHYPLWSSASSHWSPIKQKSSEGLKDSTLCWRNYTE